MTAVALVSPSIAADSLPYNIEAEQAVLASLLLNNAAYEKISDFLRPEHFADSAHGKIFEAMRRLIERGQMADAVTLHAMAEQEPLLKELGGASYLNALVDAASTLVDVTSYGKLIYDQHLRRQLMAFCHDLNSRAVGKGDDTPASEIIEQAEKHLYDLATTGYQERTYQTFETSVMGALRLAEAAYKRDGGLSGIPTGLTDLDRLLGGLQNSDLLILAGRPSMGKTSLATNIAFYAADRAQFHKDSSGKTVVTDGAVTAFFSLEMSAEQLASRVLAEQANVPSEKLRKGDMDNDEFQRLIEAAQRLRTLPLYIDDTPAITIASLRSRARRLQRQHHLGCIVVDYLQLMRGDTAASQSNRVNEISEITRGLKAIAKELNVPVIALSQLSRAVESRDDKRPQLSDLRESGSIEQDADVVMFVYREEYYLSRAEPSQKPEENAEKFNERYAQWQEKLQAAANIAEVIIAKQRHGPIGKVRMRFDGETTKFSNLMHDHSLPDD